MHNYRYCRVYCLALWYDIFLHIGITFGDPHFTTLDGFTYTFNGHGEYTMIKSTDENVTFELQARTGRAIEADSGNFTNATIFTAFAIQVNNVWFQVKRFWHFQSYVTLNVPSYFV